MQDAQEALNIAKAAGQNAYEVLEARFEEEKNGDWKRKAGITGNLKAFKALSFEGIFSGATPASPAKSLHDILTALQNLASLPEDRPVMDKIKTLGAPVDEGDIKSILARKTSLSSVAEDIKARINTDTDLFRAGVRYVHEGSQEACPFCQQDIRQGDPKALIDQYIAYFQDAEEKHKEDMRRLYQALRGFETTLKDMNNTVLRQHAAFDTWKRYSPSQSHVTLEKTQTLIQALKGGIQILQHALKDKADNLPEARARPETQFWQDIQALNEIIERNNHKVSALETALDKSKDARLQLRNEACTVFAFAFWNTHRPDFDQLAMLRVEVESKQKDLNEKEAKAPKGDAKARVATTFALLLSKFFGDTYRFDKEAFTLTAKHGAMLAMRFLKLSGITHRGKFAS